MKMCSYRKVSILKTNDHGRIRTCALRVQRNILPTDLSAWQLLGWVVRYLSIRFTLYLKRLRQRNGVSRWNPDSNPPWQLPCMRKPHQWKLRVSVDGWLATFTRENRRSLPEIELGITLLKGEQLSIQQHHRELYVRHTRLFPTN